jgi:hypothetical protein
MPPTFRAAVLRFREGDLAAASDQVAGVLPLALTRVPAIGTRRMLRRLARVPSQLPDPKLAGHQVPDPHHRILDVVDVLQLLIRLFLRQQLRHQHSDPFLQLVACHPWLPYLV